jgi:hypothetical protein
MCYFFLAKNIQSLEALCHEKRLEAEQMLMVLGDITAFAGTIIFRPPVSPAPSNHPAKIVMMGAKRSCPSFSTIIFRGLLFWRWTIGRATALDLPEYILPKF